MKKVLLVTFSDNADHQDTLFGMYEEMRKRSDWDAYLLCIKTPKVELQQSDHTWLVDCPERPGVTKKTFNLPLLLSIGHPIAAVCIRTSTERPEALEAGDFILAGITTRELLNATDMAIEMKQKNVLGKPCPDYVDETVSMKVVHIIQGYVNVVNKMVWRKG